MEIYDLVLAHLQQLLHDLQTEARRHKYHMGRPPLSLVVEQRQPSSHTHHNSGITIRRWRVTADLITAMAIDEELPAPNRVGMYYDYGKADFAIMEDNTFVRVGWMVGPLFGQGYDLPIKLKNGRPARLGTPKMLWIS